ncbi:MAG: methyltransferase [Muribaculaceae bacterium]|nr:methyltransferase [Muribaculaceae bacterium]
MGVFSFRQFDVDDSGCGMKVCSDSVLLAAWFAAAYPTAGSIADIGTGSGVLALISAQVCADAIVTGVELDAAAASAARYNFANSPFGARLGVEECDFAQWRPEGGSFDLIISNPPYFATGERSSDTARAAARHQSALGYASLVRRAPSLLAPDGHLGMVSPAESEREIIFEAELSGLKLRRILRVHTSPRKPCTRLLWDFALSDGPVDDRRLNLRDGSGALDRDYVAVVDPFYLKI